MKTFSSFIIPFFLIYFCISCSPLIVEVLELEDIKAAKTPELTPVERGRLNAVKKAAQMTELHFVPLGAIESNSSVYQAGEDYKGMIYSSVSELNTYVGTCVSFHTFMTALHNPRSVIYTEHINEPPYNGSNCRAYYGTDCSSMVSYALGLNPPYSSIDFPVSNLMTEITEIDSICVADVLWTEGHVGLITSVKYEEDSFSGVELSEAWQTGCRRLTYTKEGFYKLMSTSFKKIYRYDKIDENLSYTAVPEFVAVHDETPKPFLYNKDICVNKGDRSCYLLCEDVVINTFHDYDYIEVFRNGELYLIDTSKKEDVVLKDLPYGTYCAKLYYSGEESAETQWIVVDYMVSVVPGERIVYFSSKNASPERFAFKLKNGKRLYPYTESYSHLFTEEELTAGYVIIPADKIKNDSNYFIITFKTEFGTVSILPQGWE